MTLTKPVEAGDCIDQSANCHLLSAPINSRYHRTLSDSPWAGQQVSWRVTVRKFYCTNGHCSGKVFAERLDEVARAYGRRTIRQQQALEALGFPVSPDTLLRQVRQTPESALVPLG